MKDPQFDAVALGTGLGELPDDVDAQHTGADNIRQPTAIPVAQSRLERAILRLCPVAELFAKQLELLLPDALLGPEQQAVLILYLDYRKRSHPGTLENKPLS